MENTHYNDQKIMEKVQQMEVGFSEVKTDIKYIKDSQSKNEVQHSQIMDKLDSFIDASTTRFVDKNYHVESMAKMEEIVVGLEKRFAPRVAWTSIVWVARILGTAALIGLSTLVYRVVVLLEAK